MRENLLLRRGLLFITVLLTIVLLAMAITDPILAQQPELQISVIPGRQQVQPGETLTYTIQYTNSGAAVASNVTIIGTLLPIEQVNAITGDYQNDDRERGVVIWNIGELAPEAKDKKQLNVTIANNAAGELIIDVEIRIENEPINSSFASVQVTSPAPETQPPESLEVTATLVISTPIPVDTATPVPADTATPPPTDTPTLLPSNTPTSTQTPTSSPTHTLTPVPTATRTSTPPAPPRTDSLYYGLIFVGLGVGVLGLSVFIWFVVLLTKKDKPSNKASPSSRKPVKGAQTPISKGKMNNERLASLSKVLQTHYRKLNVFEERAARYGLNVPIEITNQIDYFKEKIKQVEEEIAALKSRR